MEEALEFNIIRIEDSVATMAAVDNWSLHLLPSVAPSRLRAINQSLGPGPHNLRLSSSAQRVYLLLVVSAGPATRSQRAALFSIFHIKTRLITSVEQEYSPPCRS